MRRSSHVSRRSQTSAEKLLFLMFGLVLVSFISLVRVDTKTALSSLANHRADSMAMDLSHFVDPTFQGTNNHPNKTQVDYYMLFSTGCHPQQHWQSFVFFYHAMKVQQPGNITRLVSGCSESDQAALTKYHENFIRPMSDRFHIFFTPEFGLGGVFKDKQYKYYNKPSSVYMWMRDVLHMNATGVSQKIQDSVIMLLDPDMILLRPLTHDFSDHDTIYASKRREGALHPPNGVKQVQHGTPMAQLDGYLNSEWQTFNATYITQGHEFPHFEKRESEAYWNSGPPYLSTVQDMWNMVNLWREYVPRVYEEYPKLFAEMYGLIIAAVRLGLKHTLVKTIAVSDATQGIDYIREGWTFVDELPDDQVCNVQAWSTNKRLPIVLHYCGRYLLGKYFFSKYRLKKQYISCETPLLTMPPRDAHLIYDHWVRPPPDRGATHAMETQNITALERKRQAFMLCGLISSVNDAARYYKTNHCNNTANFSETYNFFDDPYSW